MCSSPLFLSRLLNALLAGIHGALLASNLGHIFASFLVYTVSLVVYRSTVVSAVRTGYLLCLEGLVIFVLLGICLLLWLLLVESAIALYEKVCWSCLVVDGIRARSLTGRHSYEFVRAS